MDRAQEAGLRYQWSIPGPTPFDILQTIGNGCAFLDFDNDGNLDILLIGMNHLALYRGDGHGHFREVTHQMGLDKFHGHFLGCAIGDYDNDGYDDIYISGYRTGLLLHNDAGKGFTDVTAKAGLKPQPWGTSCAFGDYDNDGKLDLYVCNYIHYDPPKDSPLCLTANGIVSNCPPGRYTAARGVLYHNEGHGQFRDVTAQTGADQVSGNALGVAFDDFDGTGRPGIMIANDAKTGDLLQNTGHGFRNIGQRSGVGNIRGNTYSGMGIDWGDYDNDGQEDLFVGTFSNATKPIFHRIAPGLFTEESERLGLHDPAYRVLTFGAKWLDYDNDGWLDLILADGHVRSNIPDISPSISFLEPTLLFHNEYGRHFRDVSQEAGPSLIQPILGRGLAVGDYDNDGKVDVLIVNSQGAPLLLHNECRRSGHWLSLKLIGTRSNRDGIGACVTVVARSLTQTRICRTDGSYLSASDKRAHVGLGASTVATLVTVRWPSGTVSVLHDLPGDHQITIRE